MAHRPVFINLYSYSPFPVKHTMTRLFFNAAAWSPPWCGGTRKHDLITSISMAFWMLLDCFVCRWTCNEQYCNHRTTGSNVEVLTVSSVLESVTKFLELLETAHPPRLKNQVCDSSSGSSIEGWNKLDFWANSNPGNFRVWMLNVPGHRLTRNRAKTHHALNSAIHKNTFRGCLLPSCCLMVHLLKCCSC